MHFKIYGRKARYKAFPFNIIQECRKYNPAVIIEFANGTFF